jgi:large subunit ribosomal protein L24
MNKHTDNKTTAYKIRLKKGDTVMVRLGKDKGKTGKIVAVHPRDNKVTVEGVNIVKKHQKPNRAYPQGGIIEITKPIWVSKVGIVDPETKKPSRIGFELSEQDGTTTKSRIFKSSGKVVPTAKQKGEK